MRLITLAAALAFLILSLASVAQNSASAVKKTAASADDSSGALYEVEDGNKVDEKTLMGWKTWRALACERCHGAAQEGLVGPSLLVSVKQLTKEQFYETLMKGRIEKGMPSFSTSKMVKENWEGLWAYLQGRADGKIQPGRLQPLDEEKEK